MNVYLIRNEITGSCYVGQTRRTIEARFKVHKRLVGRPNACKALSDAMRKYGVENFSIELLQRCTSQEEMDRVESYFIDKLNTFAPHGYNLTRGGGGKSGYKHSPESIAKMTAAHRGKPLSAEHREKLSASLLGNKRALGLKHTEQTKRLLSEKFKGMKRPPMTAEHRAALAAARRGTKASDETRRRMSESHKRRNAARRAESLLIAHYGKAKLS